MLWIGVDYETLVRRSGNRVLVIFILSKNYRRTGRLIVLRSWSDLIGIPVTRLFKQCSDLICTHLPLDRSWRCWRIGLFTIFVFLFLLLFNFFILLFFPLFIWLELWNGWCHHFSIPGLLNHLSRLHFLLWFCHLINRFFLLICISLSCRCSLVWFPVLIW